MTALPYGFSDDQFNAVQLLGEILTNPRQLNVVETKIIKDLLRGCVHNEDFNHSAVLAAIDGEKNNSAIHRACFIMLKLNFYARRATAFDPKNPIIENEGRALDDKKLSITDGLKEIGLYRDLSMFAITYRSLLTMGVIDDFIPEISKNAYNCHEIINGLQQKFAAEGSTGFFLRKQKNPRGQLVDYLELIRKKYVNNELDANPDQRLQPR